MVSVKYISRDNWDLNLNLLFFMNFGYNLNTMLTYEKHCAIGISNKKNSISCKKTTVQLFRVCHGYWVIRGINFFEDSIEIFYPAQLKVQSTLNPSLNYKEKIWIYSYFWPNRFLKHHAIEWDVFYAVFWPINDKN